MMANTNSLLVDLFCTVSENGKTINDICKLILKTKSFTKIICGKSFRGVFISKVNYFFYFFTSRHVSYSVNQEMIKQRGINLNLRSLKKFYFKTKSHYTIWNGRPRDWSVIQSLLWALLVYSRYKLARYCSRSEYKPINQVTRLILNVTKLFFVKIDLE